MRRITVLPAVFRTALRSIRRRSIMGRPGQPMRAFSDAFRKEFGKKAA